MNLHDSLIRANLDASFGDNRHEIDATADFSVALRQIDAYRAAFAL
jgi:hypothetical protein